MTPRQEQTTAELIDREHQFMSPAARVPFFNLIIDRGEGARLWDRDGRSYIDLTASGSSCNTGYSHPHVVEAISRQAERLTNYSVGYLYQEPEMELVERLVGIAPGPTPKKAEFGNSGSDANDGIIKFARAYTGRPYMIAFQGAYHGNTFGAMSLSGMSPTMGRGMGPLVPGIYHIPYPDVYHEKLPGQDGGGTAFSSLSEQDQVAYFMRPLLEMTSSYVSPDEVACVLMEPIAGDLGIIPAPPAYVRALHAWCREHGVLFAVDEINQGMGRTGKWWSVEQYGVEPDLMSVGKSLASGMPLSAIIGRADIMDTLHAPAHCFTCAGNAVCCAAGMATLDVIEQEGLLAASVELGTYAERRFCRMAAEHAILGSIHGVGLNLGVDVVDADTREGDTGAALKVIYRAQQLGVLMMTLAGSILRFQPPLVITREELDCALDVLDQVIGEVERGEVPDSIVTGGTGW